MTRLAALLRERILVLDGAMGTMLQQANLTAADFGGPQYEGCNEHLVLTRPDVVRGIHEAYLEAGADIVETNTFGATALVLAEYGLSGKAREINRVAARLAREACDRWSTPEKPRFVAGSIGPTTKTLSLTGGTTFDELVASYREQALGLMEGGADALLVETSQDALNVKAAGVGIQHAQTELGRDIPVLLSCTIEPMGTMLAGQSVEAFYASFEHLHPLAVGLNCATGPDFMADHVRSLAALATCPVSVYPNAGLPDENGHYDETPESLARKLRRFAENGWVNLVGGCCGTTPAHIRALAAAVADLAPRAPPATPRQILSGVEFLEVDPANRPILVGERTNVIGSRKFKRLIAEGAWEEASEVGRAQVRNGAQVVDVCLADPDRNEVEDMQAFLPHLTRKVRAPLMVDSTDPDVIELFLRSVQGKAIVNSINLEDGEERFERVCPLLRAYGAAVVVGCIDEDPEQGMAVTADRKIEVARRSFDLLTRKYGIPPQDIIFDPLVFPAGTGDQTYRGSAAETIEGVRRITREFPQCATILGVSNVSFGLPPAGREVLNSVFLHHCVQAGLTYAIVNTEALTRYPSIPEEERRLAEDVLFDRGDDPVGRFTAHFRDRKAAAIKSNRASLPLDERLARCIIEGTKEGLTEDLDLALQTRKPLEIINGPLMAGMDEVGRLFNANDLIVAEVLQSAEAMKAAVAHLEPHMERSEAATKGKVLLATVKGDVHDIGKNLVDIILTNNGFRVVNLGIKVAPETLIQACREHRPDAIGLSGLLVKSAQQMVSTAEEFRAAGIQVPLLVGGAALTKKFTATRIAPQHAGPTLYAKDAMDGLALANELLAGDRTGLLKRVEAEYAGFSASISPTEGGSGGALDAIVPLARVAPLPKAPDFQEHLLRDVDPRTLYPYVNPLMLYSKHLGLKGDVRKLLAEGDEKARRLHEQVEALMEEAARKKWLTAHGIYRFFPAHSDGDDVLVYDPEAPGEKVIERFRFPRQRTSPRRCLSDYLAPVGSGDVDTLAMFTVTAGVGVREHAERLKAEGEYLKSIALQALALETAEAFAERLHQRLRTAWGFPDDPSLTLRDLFKGSYRGRRFSFGYPACPDLSDQAKLFRLLRPERLGIQLTEGYMMDPEASVSAVVFHHPEAEYFSVG
ncbi:MAG TPA: methionine synthase [Candidatus Thermoplasmatota archaeon]|nr:methionine synthase [Candidatus Thermoplasmatota archaeon]